MTIQGLQAAINIAIERAHRTKESICVVQIGDNEYILWRYKTKENIALMYEHYKIVKVIGYKNDFR